MVNPPNLTSSRQNWNLDSLNMMPFWAHGVVAIMQQHRALSSWYEGESGMQDGTGRQCHAFLIYTDCSSTESPQCVVENYPSWLWLPWHCTSLSVCPLGLEQWCHAWHHCQDQLWQLTLNEMGLEWECVVLLGWHLPGGVYGLQDQACGGKGVCNWTLTHGRSRGSIFPIQGCCPVMVGKGS